MSWSGSTARLPSLEPRECFLQWSLYIVSNIVGDNVNDDMLKQHQKAEEYCDDSYYE